METDSLNPFSFEGILEKCFQQRLAIVSLLKVGGLIPYEYNKFDH